jgi:transcriptional regulator with XRE-family HTH domain
MSYQEKLKELRIRNGYTQEDIAKVLQTTQQYYGKYENGLRPLPIIHLVALCKFYHVSSDWLLELDEHK